MAKVTYKPEPGTPDTHAHLGITFGPEPVDVTDPVKLFKLRGNPFYEVIEDGKAAQQSSANDDGLQAVHRGGGRFVIFYGDSDDEAIKGLTKADADAFNALSDADKAAYVEAHKASE